MTRFGAAAGATHSLFTSHAQGHDCSQRQVHRSTECERRVPKLERTGRRFVDNLLSTFYQQKSSIDTLRFTDLTWSSELCLPCGAHALCRTNLYLLKTVPLDVWQHRFRHQSATLAFRADCIPIPASFSTALCLHT
jgi:hypothetical protein